MRTAILFHLPTETPIPAPDAPEISITVAVIDEEGLNGLAFYSFEAKKWHFLTDTLVDYNEPGHETKWVWYYIPVTWARVVKELPQLGKF